MSWNRAHWFGIDHLRACLIAKLVKLTFRADKIMPIGFRLITLELRLCPIKFEVNKIMPIVWHWSLKSLFDGYSCVKLNFRANNIVPIGLALIAVECASWLTFKAEELYLDWYSIQDEVLRVEQLLQAYQNTKRIHYLIMKIQILIYNYLRKLKLLIKFIKMFELVNRKSGNNKRV